MPLLFSASRAKIDIVKGERDFWAALNRPQEQRDKLTGEAISNIEFALLAFPVALDMYSAYMSQDVPKRESQWKARWQVFVALSRALNARTIPHKIKTNDLLSPFDGKPLSYRFDGKQITIEVSGKADDDDSKPIQLKLPPDEPAK